MAKKVAIIHTSFVSVDDLKGLFQEIVPDAELYNIVDDSLLREVLRNGGVTEGVRQRMIQYAKHAESIGVDLVFNQCSSVGEAADEAAKHKEHTVDLAGRGGCQGGGRAEAADDEANAHDESAQDTGP